MQRFIFGFFNLHLVSVIILICLAIQSTNQTYCSSFCSYANVGNVYAPMCSGQSSSQCTKCDESLFTLVGNVCQPHGYFNQTQQILDLNSPMGLTLSLWQNTTNLFRINMNSGLYEIIEFYTDSVTSAGGDDKVFRQFTSLPAHYTVRLRFFVIRSAISTMTFNYYIDNKKYLYDYNQYPSSQTLGDIVTTDKIFHQNTSLTVAFEVQFAGLDEFIGVKELIIFISKCSQNCQLCNSSQNCVKCMPMANGSKTYLHEGYCYVECPQTRFENDTLRTCDRCQQECQNCLSNSSYCVQCKSQGRFESFLYNNSCYYDCPNNFFQNFDTNKCDCSVNGFFVNLNHTCQACASECNSCFGPLRNQCYNCSAGNYLIHGSSECSKSCPSGQYGDEFAGACYLCSPFCSQCQNSSSQCKACFFRLSVRYLHNEQCVVECPRGYGKNFTNRKCVGCPPYYFSYLGECIMQCPEMYVANTESKSCLHISETNFSLTPKVSAITVIPEGKSLDFQLSFAQGLSEISKNWIYTQAYFNVTLKGEGLSVLPTSVSVQNDYTISLNFPVDEELSEDTELQIEFSSRLNTSQNISYGRISSKFVISQYPSFLAEYFKKVSKSYFNVVMIPIFLALATLISLRLKCTYDLFIESIRLFQFVGLTVFLIYPSEGPIYSLLQGFNYFNFQFFPNIYNMFVPKFDNSLQNALFSGFSFIYGDMDFIRMIGSILVFIAVWIIVILILKCFVVKNTALLGWFLRLGMDLVEVKLIHSFWNSIIFTFMNSSKENIYMLWVHLFSYVFMGLVAFRYYKIYQSNGQINYQFIWRVVSTLLISIALFNKMIVLIFLSLVSIGFGLRHFYATREHNKQIQNFKFGIAFLMRDLTMSLMPWLSVMAVCMVVFYKGQMKSIAVIATLSAFIYILTITVVVIFLLIRYFLKRRQKTAAGNRKQDDQNQEREYNPVQQNGTLSNISQSFAQQHESYIKDEFAADFQNAHRQTIPDYEDGSIANNDSKIRTTLEKTMINSQNTKFQEPTERLQNTELKIQMKEGTQSKLFNQDSSRIQVSSDHDEELFEAKFKRAHRTEALKRKIQPMQTLTNQKVEEHHQFEHITLKKIEEEKQRESNRNMNGSELLKKKSATVDAKQNRSSPRLNTKPNLIINVREQVKKQKLEDQNIFINQEDY